MDLGIAGRTALVTGRDTATGAACERALEAEGARLVTGVSDDVDILVSVGGRPPVESILDVSTGEELLDGWADVAETVELYRRVLPSMTSRRWGRLVWVGSAAAKSLDADQAEVQAMTSLSVMAMHKVVTAEVGPSGVTANAVLRGGRAGPDDVSAVVAFLCSHGAGYLTGVTLSVDGGAASAVF